MCSEHWMPMARQVLHASGEHIHVSVWPTAHEMHHVASRHYAFEGRCFVLAAGLIMRVRDLPPQLSRPPELARDPDVPLQGVAVRSSARTGSTAPDASTMRRRY